MTMGFLNKILEAQIKKEKTDKWYFIQIKNSALKKDTMKRLQKSAGQERVAAHHYLSH